MHIIPILFIVLQHNECYSKYNSNNHYISQYQPINTTNTNKYNGTIYVLNNEHQTPYLFIETCTAATKETEKREKKYKFTFARCAAARYVCTVYVRRFHCVLYICLYTKQIEIIQ